MRKHELKIFGLLKIGDFFQFFWPQRDPRPECFGYFRSPQWDAEGDCLECEFDNACYQAYKGKENKNASSPSA